MRKAFPCKLCEVIVILERFVVKSNGQQLVIGENEVVAFKSENHVTYLLTADARYIYDLPLKQLELELNPARFLRVHRNAIVKLNAVRSWKSGDPLLLEVRPDWQIRVPKSRRKLVKKYLVKHENNRITSKAPAFVRQDSKPFSNMKMWVNPARRRALEELAQKHAECREVLQFLGSQPVGYWIGPWTQDIYCELATVISRAKLSRSIPIIVASFFHFNNDFRPAQINRIIERYLTMIYFLAKAIGSAPAILVLEPNALAFTAKLNDPVLQDRIVRLFRDSIAVLKTHTGAKVYLDAAHPNWLSPEHMAVFLARAGIDNADGFVVNTSNFIDNNRNITYAEAISQLLSDKHFMIDTSRNGQGPAADYAWCNPQGRGIGRQAGFQHKHKLVDALLWLKPPGESDGVHCPDGRLAPKAGQFWLEQAMELASLARLDADHDIL